MHTQELLDKYRDVNVDNSDWHEGVYAQFVDDMTAKGIWVDKMYYSGFWSQGDGACFEGGLYNARMFFREHALVDYPMFSKLLAQDDSALRVSVAQSGHYSHENCTRFTIEYEPFEDDSDTLMESLVEVWNTQLEQEFVTLEEEIISLFREHMCDLYSRLEAEYDYLTSDEVIDEWITDNQPEELTNAA